MAAPSGEALSILDTALDRRDKVYIDNTCPINCRAVAINNEITQLIACQQYTHKNFMWWIHPAYLLIYKRCKIMLHKIRFLFDIVIDLFCDRKLHIRTFRSQKARLLTILRIITLCITVTFFKYKKKFRQAIISSI